MIRSLVFLALMVISLSVKSQDTSLSLPFFPKYEIPLDSSFQTIFTDWKYYPYSVVANNDFVHNSEAQDTANYRHYYYLINQAPTVRNHKKYAVMAWSLYNLGKLKAAEKMLLNIVRSGIKPYVGTYYHSSDIPGDTTTNIYGYGSYTSSYKNSASLYLAKIYLEKKRYTEALKYLNYAVHKYQVYYTCGTGANWQRQEYYSLYAACYQGLHQYRNILDLCLPDYFEWDPDVLIGAARKLYKQEQIEKYLTEAKQSIACLIDTVESWSITTTFDGEGNEKTDTARYYSGTGTFKLFNKIVNFPHPSLKDGETLTRDYFVNLFMSSAFYKEFIKEDILSKND